MSSSTKKNGGLSKVSLYASDEAFEGRLAARRRAAEEGRRAVAAQLKELSDGNLVKECGKNALPRNKTEAIVQGSIVGLVTIWSAATSPESAISAAIKGAAKAAAGCGLVNLARNDQGEIRELIGRGFSKVKQLNPLAKKEDQEEDELQAMTPEEREELLRKLLKESKKDRVIDVDDEGNVKEE